MAPESILDALMAIPKTKHLRCRIDPPLHRKIKQGASRERMKDSDFARQLLELAAELYSRAGSLWLLRAGLNRRERASARASLAKAGILATTKQ